eukprot:218023-Chlamydomonas_euryale.AAC.2
MPQVCLMHTRWVHWEHANAAGEDAAHTLGALATCKCRVRGCWTQARCICCVVSAPRAGPGGRLGGAAPQSTDGRPVREPWMVH